MKNGIVVIDKPAGMTSHDVVNQCRKIFRTRQVGHTGTLDPDATGILPVCIGSATRLAEYLTSEDKSYEVTMIFGEDRDTQDASGQVLRTCSLPNVDETGFESVLEHFKGNIVQEVPIYSAVKINGEPLYKLARENRLPEAIPSREIHIFDLCALSYNAHEAQLRVHCSKGTYIRTLCLDIAKALGSLAYVKTLRRISSGHYTLNDAVSLDILQKSSDPESYVMPMKTAMKNYPSFVVGGDNKDRILHGQSIPLNNKFPEGIATALFQDDILAVGWIKEDHFRPKKVFKQEV